MAPAEADALSVRFKAARDNANNRGLVQEFDALVSAVSSASHVVVAMLPLCARNILTDPRTLYAGYESLVGGGIRIPAPFANDSERHAVSGRLFGNHAAEIRYGVLSLDGAALPNYGLVFVTLRDVAIEQRVSFLHENSYLFMDTLGGPLRGDLPRGFRSAWPNRSELVAAKIEPKLTAGSTIADWSRQLVVQGKTREQDSCVEAHIFGSFNAHSIESVSFAGRAPSHQERNDVDCIKELMAKRGSAGASP